MPIQFCCSGCGQAIEVDDEYANRPIACPFCHATVTAPPTSQLQAPPPVAAPVGTGATFTGALAPAAVAPAKSAWLCTLGMLCGIGLFFMTPLWMALMMFQSGAVAKLQSMQAQPRDPKAEQELLVQSIRAWVQAHAGTNLTLAALTTVFVIVGLSSSIAGLVRCDTRRWQAVLGLIFCGLCGACTAIIIINGLLVARGATP